MSKYRALVTHQASGKIREITGTDKAVVTQKAQWQMRQWDADWQRKQEQERVARERERALDSRKQEQERVGQDRERALDSRKQEQERVVRERQRALDHRKAQEKKAELDTKAAVEALSACEGILAHTLTIDDAINWASLKDHSHFPEPQPLPATVPTEPLSSDPAFQPQISMLDRLSSSRIRGKKENATNQYLAAHAQWEAERDRVCAGNRRLLSEWQAREAEFSRNQTEANKRLDETQTRYFDGDSGPVSDYCEMVLSNSTYPDSFPRGFNVDYAKDVKTIVVDFQLPDLDDLPRIREVKYVANRDELKEVSTSETERNSLYDSVVHQIVLRSVHELFEADRAGAVDVVVFNGWVKFTDKASGVEQSACIVSLSASKKEFMGINLSKVDPKACFRGLKGVGSPKLHNLTPVAPLLQMSREDKRFIQSYEVASRLQEGDNLAAMDWTDFEHLIRELFEKEFAGSGGEVKVTQASRDQGVDAVAFDPDPIRGGKIVIQAKRYVGIVDVSAVRDLYGTVLNEGANKGILVTTSDYGPESRDFVRGKPLTLLNGANLLHLLGKHGHKARIDLPEAKRLLAERER